MSIKEAAPAEPLAVEAVQSRCPQTVDGATFYAHTGNDYHGEFRALQRAWGRGDGVGLLFFLGARRADWVSERPVRGAAARQAVAVALVRVRLCKRSCLAQRAQRGAI